MADKQTLKTWVLEALQARGGSATVVEVAESIWREHEAELRNSGRLFYTWQYDVRWAAYQLREHGLMKPEKESPKGRWELTETAPT